MKDETDTILMRLQCCADSHIALTGLDSILIRQAILHIQHLEAVNKKLVDYNKALSDEIDRALEENLRAQNFIDSMQKEMMEREQMWVDAAFYEETANRG